MTAIEVLKKINELLIEEVMVVDQEMLDLYYAGELEYWDSGNFDDCFTTGIEVGADETTLELASKISKIIKQVRG